MATGGNTDERNRPKRKVRIYKNPSAGRKFRPVIGNCQTNRLSPRSDAPPRPINQIAGFDKTDEELLSEMRKSTRYEIKKSLKMEIQGRKIAGRKFN